MIDAVKCICSRWNNGVLIVITSQFSLYLRSHLWGSNLDLVFFFNKVEVEEKDDKDKLVKL